jgi:hypothetical protein
MSTGVAPDDVGEANQEDIWTRVYEKDSLPKKKRPRLSVGDHVRITKARGAFERGFTPNWSIEIFTVSSVRTDTSPIVYEIKDQAGESVEGTFYELELQRVSLPDTFKVESILKKRKRGRTREMLVKWLGYPASMNSWVKESDFV